MDEVRADDQEHIVREERLQRICEGIGGVRAQTADDDRQKPEVAEAMLKERILDLRAVFDPVDAVVRAEHRRAEHGVPHVRVQRDRAERGGDGIGHRHDREVADAVSVTRCQQDHAPDFLAVDRRVSKARGRPGVRIPGVRHDDYVARLLRHGAGGQERIDHGFEAGGVAGIPRTGDGRCESLRCGHDEACSFQKKRLDFVV